MTNNNATAPDTAPANSGLWERFTVEIVTGATISDFTVDLTGVGGEASLSSDADLAAHMRVLEPLRTWLEAHGALTPGNEILVRTLPERSRPEDIAAEQALPGTVLERRELRTILGEPHTPVGM